MGRKKRYLEVCSPQYLISMAHTVKTFDKLIYTNAWNGEYVCRTDKTRILTVNELYQLAKTVERDGIIIASRSSLEFPLQFLAKPYRISKNYWITTQYFVD